jgi:hypothetical protein
MSVLESLQGKEVKWLNEKEVADITGRSVCTLRNERCKRVGIAYSKVGRSVRYLLADVILFMETHKITVE